MSDDFFAELDAEIAVHIQKSKIKKDAAIAKKKATDRSLSDAERRAADAFWRECQAVIDAEIWRPVSLVAFFTQQECDGCGSVHRVFLQYMEQQVLRRKPDNKRWVRVSVPEALLPKTVLVQHHKTHVCADCASDHGFAFEEAHFFHMPSPLGISSTYVQGDINAQTAESGSTAPIGIEPAGVDPPQA